MTDGHTESISAFVVDNRMLADSLIAENSADLESVGAVDKCLHGQTNWLLGENPKYSLDFDKDPATLAFSVHSNYWLAGNSV